MAKKYNRCRPQKRNIDQQKIEKYREELAREPETEIPEGHSDRGSSIDINLRRQRNPLS